MYQSQFEIIFLFINYILENSNGTAIIKGCAALTGGAELGCESVANEKGKLDVCFCEGELCNASPDKRTSSKVSILLVAFLTNFFKNILNY